MERIEYYMLNNYPSRVHYDDRTHDYFAGGIWDDEGKPGTFAWRRMEAWEILMEGAPATRRQVAHQMQLLKHRAHHA